MPPPLSAPSLPAGSFVTHNAGIWSPSPVLVDLLLTARHGYAWPLHDSNACSQQRIINLESQVAAWLDPLTPTTAHLIVLNVSAWAGNQANIHQLIAQATAHERQLMQNALQLCSSPNSLTAGLHALCQLPGVSLVIASKIYRFCQPVKGAAVDRHASYFTNSLSPPGVQTEFLRRWSTANHDRSRLETFNAPDLNRNLNHYIDAYLPLLDGIAAAMNATGHYFQCAASGHLQQWTPADVEMAAFYWWACNGAQ
ncbi:hypothetical protein LOY54_18025 [Pseudomonas sp. B21-032]|uniref:hypothetical protein n=1 Tax=Pseudomonas sp. B21-032 TaxID=2895483 RepID=UPI00215DFF90|nr:hypothetical protein [Pseudomonas sp. B21-032]UVL59931.1 hypothetical protein LOY54_18025 [Pseudomonas sp. B21-032]